MSLLSFLLFLLKLNKVKLLAHDFCVTLVPQFWWSYWRIIGLSGLSRPKTKSATHVIPFAFVIQFSTPWLMSRSGAM